MNSSGGDGAAAAAAAGGMFLMIALFYLAIFGLMIWIYWKIASKAGYPGAFALLMLVPCVNLIMIIMFAFTEWPIERALREARMGGGGGAPWPTPYPHVPAPGYEPPAGAPAPTEERPPFDA